MITTSGAYHQLKRTNSRSKNIITLSKSILFILIITVVPSLFNPTNSIHGKSNILLYDDFNDGNSNDWTEEIFNGDWYVDNGEYVGTASPSGDTRRNSYTYNGDSSWKNYSFSVKIKGIDNVDKTIFFYFNKETRSAYEVDLRSHYATSNGNDIVLFKSPDLKSDGGSILATSKIENYPNVYYNIRIEVLNITEDVSIKVYVDNNLLIDYIDKKTSTNTPFYQGAVGLLVWPQTPNTTTFDNVLVQKIETETPTSTPTPITTPPPTPTPTPPPTKVILAPGMGASWNADAILNCKLDNYSGNWTMAPFAEDIYQPLISSLQDNGFTVYPFYYDWRKNIPSHNQEIDNLINNLQLLENEKINFVGHSMGGLVGRAYLENNNDNKIYKYISAGSPHQGTALAYPAWYGGQIWNNSLVTKIAATLLIKRCGINHKNDMETLRSIAPSFQDLLPTYTFLRDRNVQLKGVDKNKWLLESNFPPQTNTIIATLSGKGFETLENIKVKEPNKKEKKEGIWEEGKPSGKETTYQGDGTVLSKSAKVEGVQNFEINQNHSGLVYSQEGIQTIINFLKGEANTTELTSTANEEPGSALVIIAHPATFLTIDTKGKIKKDKNNVAAYLNPKSGKYKIGILPLANESTLLVGQFLKNGDYSWKEYKIKGKLPLAKTINFKEDIILENPLQ